MTKLKVRITLTEEMLGTKASNPDVFTDFIASKAPDGDKRKEELETAEHREEAGTTVFHRMPWGTVLAKAGKEAAVLFDGHAGIAPDTLILGLWDYQFKGFFKDACGALRNADGTLSKQLTAYKTRIDGLIFPAPRFIPVFMPDNTKPGVCERPLRAETAQGPRVSLCRSETVPAGSWLQFEVVSLAKKIGKGDDAVDVEDLLKEWFDYGALRGLGQWRNSGKGRFTYEFLGNGKA